MQSLLELKQSYIERKTAEDAEEARKAQELQQRRDEVLSEEITPLVIEDISIRENVEHSALQKAVEVTALNYSGVWKGDPEPLIPNGVRVTINLAYHSEVYVDLSVNTIDDQVVSLFQPSYWIVGQHADKVAKSLAEALALAEDIYRQQNAETQQPYCDWHDGQWVELSLCDNTEGWFTGHADYWQPAHPRRMCTKPFNHRLRIDGDIVDIDVTHTDAQVWQKILSQKFPDSTIEIVELEA